MEKLALYSCVGNGFVGAGDYTAWFELVREAIAAKESSAVRAVMGDNAVRVYRPRPR